MPDGDARGFAQSRDACPVNGTLPISCPCDMCHGARGSRVAEGGARWRASFPRATVYVALTNIPEGGLLTGFAMRSDPIVVFG